MTTDEFDPAYLAIQRATQGKSDAEYTQALEAELRAVYYDLETLAARMEQNATAWGDAKHGEDAQSLAYRKGTVETYRHVAKRVRTMAYA